MKEKKKKGKESKTTGKTMCETLPTSIKGKESHRALAPYDSSTSKINRRSQWEKSGGATSSTPLLLGVPVLMMLQKFSQEHVWY